MVSYWCNSRVVHEQASVVIISKPFPKFKLVIFLCYAFDSESKNDCFTVKPKTYFKFKPTWKTFPGVYKRPLDILAINKILIRLKTKLLKIIFFTFYFQKQKILSNSQIFMNQQQGNLY